MSDTLTRIETYKREEIAAAVEFARAAPAPEARAAYTDVMTAGAGMWQ